MVGLRWRNIHPNRGGEHAMPWARMRRLRDKDENQARIQERTSRAWRHCRAEYRNRVPNHPARTQRIPEMASDFVYENVDGIVTHEPAHSHRAAAEKDRWIGFTALRGATKAVPHRRTMQAIAREPIQSRKADLMEMMGFKFESAYHSIASSARARSDGGTVRPRALAAADQSA